MKLLIDIGNRRLKWATSDQFETLQRESVNQQMGRQNFDIGKFSLSTLDAHFKNLPNPDSIWISSVADPSIIQEIDRWCKNCWRKVPVLVSSEFAVDGIENGYQRPDELGVDRWAAMIGGQRYIRSGATVVVDAGTAITVDYVDGAGKYSGGVILPGIVTMINSLNKNTGKIAVLLQSDAPSQIQYQNGNTQKAVENGAILAAVASVNQAVAYYQSIGSDTLNILITGGDAEIIAKLSSHNLRLIPELVLAGLLTMAGGVGR